MAVGLQPPSQLFPVQGIRLAAARCGIKPGSDKADLALVEIAAGATRPAMAKAIAMR